MARVWFVRRRGGQWIAPGGTSAFERPFTELVFPLDIGTHRRVSDERPIPAPEEAAVAPSELEHVFVEVDGSDLDGVPFSGYAPGIYDSPYSPREAVRRLGATRTAAGRSAA